MSIYVLNRAKRAYLKGGFVFNSSIHPFEWNQTNGNRGATGVPTCYAGSAARLRIAGFSAGIWGDPSFWNGIVCTYLGNFVTGGSPAPLFDGTFTDKNGNCQWWPANQMAVTNFMEYEIGTGNSQYLRNNKSGSVDDMGVVLDQSHAVYAYDFWRLNISFIDSGGANQQRISFTKTVGNERGLYTYDPAINPNSLVNHAPCFDMPNKSVLIESF